MTTFFVMPCKTHLYGKTMVISQEMEWDGNG